MTSVEAARVARLDDGARRQVEHLLASQPFVASVLAARVSTSATLDAAVLGGTMVGGYQRGDLTALAFHGGNLLPIAADLSAARAIGEWLAGTRRRCTSIVGRADAVEAMWPALESSWGPAREIRHEQPMLVLARADAPTDGHHGVRVMRRDDFDRYLPAAAAMFGEELGVSPFANSTGPAYRRRIEALIENGRAFGLVDDDGRIAFKADLAVVTPETCQVQGVWTRPDLRGNGLAEHALAAVFLHALRLAPTVSLYVNDFNAPARALYRRLKMTQVATLSTVLF